MQLVGLDSSHPERPQQTAGPAAAAGGQTGVWRKAGWVSLELCGRLGRGCQGVTKRGALSGVVTGLRSLILNSSYDVLVGRQQGGAVAEVALADGVLATADDLLITRHVERSLVCDSTRGCSGWKST